MTLPLTSSNQGVLPPAAAGSPPLRRSFLVRWVLHGLAMAALGGLIGLQLWVEYDRAEGMERERLINHARMIGQNLSQELEATYHTAEP